MQHSISEALTLLSRAEQLGKEGAEKLAAHLENLGVGVLETYDLAQPQDYTDLYGGLVRFCAANRPARWDNSLARLCEQVTLDTGRPLLYQFVPAFYETVVQPIARDMTGDAVDAALDYLEINSPFRGTRAARELLSFENCFGPRITRITPEEIGEVLAAHGDDKLAGRVLASRFRLVAVGPVKPTSRAVKLTVGDFPGRVRDHQVSYREGVPGRLPDVLRYAAAHIPTLGVRRF